LRSTRVLQIPLREQRVQEDLQMTRFASIACMLALVLVSCGAMFAQTGALDVYQVTYYDNNYGDGAYFDAGTIRIINPGLTGSPISPTQGTLCANIYVFDDTQEM